MNLQELADLLCLSLDADTLADLMEAIEDNPEELLTCIRNNFNGVD